MGGDGKVFPSSKSKPNKIFNRHRRKCLSILSMEEKRFLYWKERDKTSRKRKIKENLFFLKEDFLIFYKLKGS